MIVSEQFNWIYTFAILIGILIYLVSVEKKLFRKICSITL